MMNNDNNVQQRLAELLGIVPEDTRDVTAYKAVDPAFRLGTQYASLEEIPAYEKWPYLEVQGPDGDQWLVGLYQCGPGEFFLAARPGEEYRTIHTGDLWRYWTFETTIPAAVKGYCEE
jgi:hypothetical protein